MYLCLPHQSSGTKHKFVTASLRIMKPVCITANILLLTTTIFPLAIGCWDHPEFAFGWNMVTVAKVLFFAGQAPLKYASADPSLSQAMSWSAVSLPSFSVLFLPYVASKTLAQSICQILGGREMEWVGHNYHYTMQHTQLDTPYKKRHLDSDASKVVLTKSKRGEFSKLEQHLFCQDMIQMARQWEIFGWALLVLVPLISWTDKQEKKYSINNSKEVIEHQYLILGLEKHLCISSHLNYNPRCRHLLWFQHLLGLFPKLSASSPGSKSSQLSLCILVPSINLPKNISTIRQVPEPCSVAACTADR